jgi:hypothetical protein
MTTQYRKKKGASVFGVSLEDVLASYSQEPNSLPVIVSEVTSHLKRYALGCEYIFMKSGPDVTVQLLRKLYNSHGSVQLEKYSQSGHCIAWLLRTFLSELPEPLLTRKFGSSFIKTQSNPDLTARYRNMRKLLNALPTVNRAVIRAVLELFRLVLHHRRKNKLTVSGFCSDMGPILLGVDKTQNAADAALASEVLKTLITQFQFMMGTTDEPAEFDSLPLYTKKSQRVLLTSNSRARGLIQRKRTHTPTSSNGGGASGSSLVNGGASAVYASAVPSLAASLGSSGGFGEAGYSQTHIPPSSNSPPPMHPNEAEELISLTDGIMIKFLDQSVRSVLFEPQVRISFNYEAKLPNHLKRNYTLDKLTEIHRGSAAAESRLGAWRPSEEEAVHSGAASSSAASNARHRRDTTTSTNFREDEDGSHAGTTRHRRNTASGSRDESFGSIGGSGAGGTASSRKSTIPSGNYKDDRSEGKDQSDHHSTGTDSVGGGDDASSGSGASSRRRSRRISINEDIGPVDDHLRQLTRTTSEDLTHRSDDIANHRNHRISVDNLEGVLEYSTDSSGSDGEASPEQPSSSAPKRRKKHTERRSSTSKASTGARVRLKDKEMLHSHSQREPRRKKHNSGEFAPDSARYGPTDAPITPNPHTGAVALPSTSTGYSKDAPPPPPPADSSLSLAGASATAAAAAAPGATPAAAAAPTKAKAPRPKSKPPQLIMDSKMIMEMAPSPPSEMPPPLALPATATPTPPPPATSI